jgi:hypothetical protein
MNQSALILALLLVLTASDVVLLAKSNINTKIVSPPSPTANAGQLNSLEGGLINGANWIWNSQGDLSPIGAKLTF